LQQQAHVGQREGQAGQRGPGHARGQRLSCHRLCEPPSLPRAAPPEGKARGQR
jgi:hypothetical protein